MLFVKRAKSALKEVITNMKDLHIHLEKGPYTVEWAEKFIEKAIDTGMSEICLLEHSIRFFDFHPTFKEACEYNRYQRRWFDGKVKSAHKLSEFKELAHEIRKRDYPIAVKFGLEICWFEQHEDTIRSIASDDFFDYLIGSVHWIDNWTFNQRKYQWLGEDYNLLYQRYFALQSTLIESGIFDIIAHPDLIRCHSLFPDYDLKDTYKNLCENAINNNVSIELNTSKSLGINEEFLSVAKSIGASFSTGSDAHRPEDVGRRIKEVTDLYAVR